MPQGPRETDSHIAEAKILPPVLKCFSSLVRCGSQDCLMPKEKG